MNAKYWRQERADRELAGRMYGNPLRWKTQNTCRVRLMAGQTGNSARRKPRGGENPPWDADIPVSAPDLAWVVHQEKRPTEVLGRC